MDACDDGAFGSQSARNHLVRIALCIDVLISLLDVFLATIGTFVLYLGEDSAKLMFLLAGCLICLSLFFIILYRAMPRLQRHPSDCIYLFIRRIIRATIFFLLALVLPIWFVLGLTLAQHGYMLSVIILTFCLDVQGVWIHLIAAFVVVVTITVGYVFLHTMGYFTVVFVLFVILYAFFESTIIGLNIFWTLVWWKKLNLQEQAYWQETVYIMNGHMPLCCACCRCCACCEPE